MSNLSPCVVSKLLPSIHPLLHFGLSVSVTLFKLVKLVDWLETFNTYRTVIYKHEQKFSSCERGRLDSREPRCFCATSVQQAHVSKMYFNLFFFLQYFKQEITMFCMSVLTNEQLPLTENLMGNSSGTFPS